MQCVTLLLVLLKSPTGTLNSFARNPVMHIRLVVFLNSVATIERTFFFCLSSLELVVVVVVGLSSQSSSSEACQLFGEKAVSPCSS